MLLFHEGDFAMARLRSAPAGSSGIPKQRIVVRRSINPREHVTVIANFAINTKSGNNDELTETT